MSNCEHADQPICEDYKGRYCKLTDRQLCWNYDKPELVEKCPILEEHKRVTV
jgi:hypothetical protein